MHPARGLKRLSVSTQNWTGTFISPAANEASETQQRSAATDATACRHTRSLVLTILYSCCNHVNELLPKNWRQKNSLTRLDESWGEIGAKLQRIFDMAKFSAGFFSKTFQGAVATLPFSFCGCKITAPARHGQMFSQVFSRKISPLPPKRWKTTL